MAPKLRLTGGPKEDDLQASIAQLLHLVLPEWIAWSHFPAGGYYLTPAARARLTRLGLTKGFPDLLICLPHGKCLWMEVKSELGRVEYEQRLRHAQLNNLGHPVEVVRCTEDVMLALDKYQVPHKAATLIGGSFGSTIDTRDAQGRTTQSPQSQTIPA